MKPTMTPRATARQLMADERTRTRPSPSARHRLGIVYPNTYFLGMSNLGHQLVWKVVNETAGWACERLYCDFEPPVSVETQSPARAFDVIAFSVAFELDYLNVLQFLQSSGIPLDAEARGPEHPLIVGAGVCIDVNRHPIYRNMDVLVNSEGEEVMQRFTELFDTHGESRRNLLAALADTEGFEVTAGACTAHGLECTEGAESEFIPRRPRLITENLGAFECCSHIVTPNTEFSSMCLVEMARGCPYRCTFCYVGHNLNPYRVVPLETIQDWITDRMEWTNRFGLVASAVASHPQIDDICRFCDEKGVEVSYSSLRAEDVTPPMIHTLARSGARTLTIAPEAGSYRLRRLLGKAKLPDERIFWTVEEAVKAGIPNLKMYFMIGLPTETEDDIAEIPALLARIHQVFVAASRPFGRIGSLGLNVGIFVPKFNTPLEKFDMMPMRQVKRHSVLLQKMLSKVNNLRVQAPSVSMAQVQTVLSKGGLRSNDLLTAAMRHKGCWKDALRDYDALAAAVAAA